jgi:hypothetical protein
MENANPHHSPRRAAALLTALTLVAGCGRSSGSDVAWGTALRLEGARNEVVYVVAEETGVPAEVLLALGFQQSRFEDPEILAESAMEGEADVPEDLLDAEFPMDAERLLEEPDFEPGAEWGDDLTVPGFEALGEEVAADPTTEAFVLAEEAEADPLDVDLPTDLDTTVEELSEDEEGDTHPALDAAGVFFLTSEQVTWAARHLSVDEEEVRSDLETNTRAAAALLLGDLAVDGTTVETATHRRWEEAMVRFVGLDPEEDAGVLMRVELHAILAEGFDHFTADGERLMLVEAGVPLEGLDFSTPPEEEPAPDLLGDDTSVAIEAARGSYPGGIEWIPASSSNYSTGRGGSRIRYVVIHDIEGTMPGAIAVFRNPRYAASAHYIVRARDGHIVQMVRESDRAWHAGHWLFNSSSIGIEHEGFAYRPNGGGYYTERQYRASAELVCAIARRYDIPIDRRHIVGHANVPRSRNSTTLCPDSRPCGGSAGHTDPGRYWNWRLYMSLVSACVGGRDVPSGEAPRARPPASRRAISTGWGGQRASLDGAGNLHVFAVDARHRLVENVRSSGDWSGWRVITGSPELRGFPASVLAPSGEIYVAVRGADDQVHLVRRSAGGSWGTPTVLTGLDISAMPSLFVNPDGRVEVFVRGQDHAAWHAAERSVGGEWGRWWSLGGELRTMVTVVANPDGAPHIFAIGDGAGHVFHRARTAPNTWASWRYLAARGNTPVSPIRLADGRLGVLVRNTEGRLVQQFQNGGSWGRPVTVGGNLTSNVVASLDARGRVNVFSRGTDGALYRVVRNAGGRWGTFVRLGGRATMGPVVTLTSNGLEVFVAGRNHALYHAHQARGPRNGWSGWHPHGGRLGWL